MEMSGLISAETEVRECLALGVEGSEFTLRSQNWLRVSVSGSGITG